MENLTIEEVRKQWESSINSTASSVIEGSSLGYGVINTIEENIEDAAEESKPASKNYINDESYDIKAVTIWSILSEKSVTIDLNASYASELASEAIATKNLTTQSKITGATTEESSFSPIQTSDSSSRTSLTAAMPLGVFGSSSADNWLYTAGSAVVSASNEVSGFISSIASKVGKGDIFSSTISSILGVISDEFATYQDGISETTFGNRMEETWYSNQSKGFLNYFATGTGNYKLKILNSTPLDSGDRMESLYGNLMLGAPFLFNNLADPDNRTLINSFVKDGRFLSLTPGLPKYNGGSYTQTLKNSLLYQTETPADMLSYLLKNGLDKDFSNKDKRYYTFQTKYEEYYAYLEAMLIPIWIKLGLGTDGTNFNIFSFFDIKSGANGEEGNIDVSSSGNYKTLKEKYKSIGFFLNASSAVSESINSQPTTFGSEIGASANDASDNFQKINFLTGMGTGGSLQGTRAIVGRGLKVAEQTTELIGDVFRRTGQSKSFFSIIPNLLLDIADFSSTRDLSSVIQSFAVMNGMKVTYPELWNDSSYSKNMNFNLSFTSPYGDPLSIFQYVYVPFCALLCFALPRQADTNGYVSPFFVRADIPGLVSSDLALVTDVTWTKGGDNNLWTKDGLPRSISCAITVTDLYPYLAMTKRYSFLSANPSYTVFLDNMTGLCALNNSLSDDPLNDYWKQMLNRISGENSTAVSGNLWNKYTSAKQSLIKAFGNAQRKSVSGNISENVVPWLTKT